MNFLLSMFLCKFCWCKKDLKKCNLRLLQVHFFFTKTVLLCYFLLCLFRFLKFIFSFFCTLPISLMKKDKYKQMLQKQNSERTMHFSPCFYSLFCFPYRSQECHTLKIWQMEQFYFLILVQLFSLHFYFQKCHNLGFLQWNSLPSFSCPTSQNSEIALIFYIQCHVSCLCSYRQRRVKALYRKEFCVIKAECSK